MTPDNPEDVPKLEERRGQGTGSSGLDQLPSEKSDEGETGSGGQG